MEKERRFRLVEGRSKGRCGVEKKKKVKVVRPQARKKGRVVGNLQHQGQQIFQEGFGKNQAIHGD